MKLENSFTVPVPVDQAWQVLQDVERIAPCMPGATLDTVDGDDFTGRVKVKVGPIMLTYSGKATFADKDETAHAMTIQASGKETRGSGTAKATVQASMQAEGNATKVLLTTDLAVTGKPAQFGRGVMADVSGKLIDQFAKCLAEEVGSSSVTTEEADRSASTSGTAVSESGSASAVSSEVVSSAAATADAPATPPLPPAGAPQQASPAPATPLPAAGLSPSTAGAAAGSNGAAPARTSTPAATGSPARSRPQQAEAIDLLGTAGMPVAKRLVPVAAGLVLVIVLVRMLRRR